jgi:hypothetical protein
LQCTPYDGKPKSDKKFLFILNIFSSQNSAVSLKIFFGFSDAKEKTGQVSVEGSFLSRFLINSTNLENLIELLSDFKKLSDTILLFNHPIFLLSNFMGVYAHKSKLFIRFKRSIANSRVFFCSYGIFND